MLTQRTLCLLVFCGVLLSCELSKDLKFLPETASTVVMNIQHKDSAGDVIFWKDNADDPICSVGVKEYDSLHRVTRSYSIHSNTGASISEYLYDSASNNTVVFGYDRVKKTIGDDLFNPYAYISSYKHRADVLSDSLIVDLLAHGDKHVVFERTFDTQHHELQEILFHGTEPSEVTTHHYDSTGHLLQSYAGKKVNTIDTYYHYDSLGRLTGVKSRDRVFGFTEEYRYTYSPSNQIKETIYLDAGKQQYREVYFYNGSKKVREDYFDEGGTLTFQTYYTYDSTGRLQTQTRHDLKRNRKKVYRMVEEVVSAKMK